MQSHNHLFARHVRRRAVRARARDTCQTRNVVHLALWFLCVQMLFDPAKGGHALSERLVAGARSARACVRE